MSQQLVKDNKHTYPALRVGPQGSIRTTAGPNLFGRHLWYETNYQNIQRTITGISDVINISRLDTSKYDSSIIKYNITGTFTKNIEDGILYYQITSVAPNNDPTIIIPANPYSDTDNVNVTLYQHKNNLNYIGMSVRIFAVTRDNKEVTFKVNMNTKATCY